GDGKVRRYQIITPTTWNFSPKDSRGTSGPVEQSIVGTMIKDRENPIEIYHIIRSYDPCIFCSVHLINQSQRKK
ncbi:nickel-dependent hydrogenase large subunit, partial [Candidatus Aerophobetes bacterium]|nr:nickel-dependent hydrogenase large subunit [Candidatus Aerophobetes bacterium]